MISHNATPIPKRSLISNMVMRDVVEVGSAAARQVNKCMTLERTFLNGVTYQIICNLALDSTTSPFYYVLAYEYPITSSIQLIDALNELL